MTETPPRLNLIQRAMRHSTPLHKSGRADHAAPEKINDKTQIGFTDLKPTTDAAASERGGEGKPVQLDYAKLRASRIATPKDKTSATYNEFRSVKRKLLSMVRDPKTGAAKTGNVVMITSALPGEGKTFTAMNLAIGLAAEYNLNVILVDGDVVRGSIAGYFRSEDQDGLVDLLTHKQERIENVLHSCSDFPNLHVLFAGNPNESAPELLASQRMSVICTGLSRRCQNGIVIVDSPPILVSSEPASMTAHIDHLIMLVAAGQAGRHQIEQALSEVARCQSISLLFNRSPEWERPLPHYNYYGYGQDKTGIA